MLGSVLEVEDPTIIGNRGYLRLRVDFDMSKPLATFIQLPRANSSTSRIRLQYENLRNFCFNCGRLGHMFSSCRYQVNPILVSMGVKYDNSLIADPPQKPVFTQSSFPAEFPYVPTTGIFGRNKRGSFQSKNLNSEKLGSSEHNGPNRAHNSTSDGDLTAKYHSAGPSWSLRDKSLSPLRLHRPRIPLTGPPHLWDPDAHGTFFRNGSVTRALGGLSIKDGAWADPECIPPWAFQNKHEYYNSNPHFPVPTEIDNFGGPLIKQAGPPYIQLIELNLADTIVSMMEESTTMPGVTKRKRKPKKSLEEGGDSKPTPKRPKILQSPRLRLSNTGGRGRGRGRGGRGRGRNTTDRPSKHPNPLSSDAPDS
ncbi:putative transcription factor interactor and regulator CCHC(Zn) family [Rosa chinensis]|uniref:Putative transcription factor interactor and regulator CCHC(Zn) family n=1 Tax=Rosa chinensis TaxID=74649 RepID=A0A2P6Q940_ROSCH|nr:putative transcription factor interactor and regulator CCHC(Zn) family [Rosa chinensis]